MSVVLNEIAIGALLNAENGPVGLDLRRRAEEVTRRARENASVIISTVDMNLLIDFRITSGTDGLAALIGPDGRGTISNYLVGKEARERVWLTPALRDGFDA